MFFLNLCLQCATRIGKYDKKKKIATLFKPGPEYQMLDPFLVKVFNKLEASRLKNVTR